jgi:hypothetical protein
MPFLAGHHALDENGTFVVAHRCVSIDAKVTWT